MKESNKKVGAPIGNKNSVKENPATSSLSLRITPAEKAAWVKAANPGKLSDWVRHQLNLAAINHLLKDGHKAYVYDRHAGEGHISVMIYKPELAPDFAEALEEPVSDFVERYTDQYGFDWEFNPPKAMPADCVAMYRGML